MRTAATVVTMEPDKNSTFVEYMTRTLHGRGGWPHEPGREAAAGRDHASRRPTGRVDPEGRRDDTFADGVGAHAPGRGRRAAGPGPCVADGRLRSLATCARGHREPLGAGRLAINCGRRGERARRAARCLTAPARRDSAR